MSEKRITTEEPRVTTNEDGALEMTEGKVKTVSTVSKGRGPDKVTFAPDLEHTLDFEGTTLQELMHLATATVVIKLQGQWRELEGKCTSEDGKSTNVHEFINRPVNRTMRPAEDVFLEKVDKGEIGSDELEKIIAALQAKLNG